MKVSTSLSRKAGISMASIGFLLCVETISYIGMLIYMGILQKRGKLTEQFFALSQLGYLNLYMLTGFLISPLTPKVTLVFLLLMIILWVVGYPFARWLYRQIFQKNNL